MVRYAKTEGCRKRAIHAYFGLPLENRCGACDGCRPTDQWIESTVDSGSRRAVPRTAPGQAGTDADAPLQRGDWIDVRGHGLCAVTRVHRSRGGSTRIDVERARDLVQKSFELGRIRWQKIERDG